MALIDFKNVKKAFGPKVIYKNLNLEIVKGESLTIIGGSGVGKSVMLKLLVGLLPVDEGSILFDGEDIVTMDREKLSETRRRIGMLFQGAALFDSLSVSENVAYGLREHLQMSEKEIDDRVAESLEAVGLPGIEHMWPADLSGGMKKRVGLARAIAVRPEVLLYDEPTTGLDPINTTRINDLILRLNDTLNVTTVVVTHDMNSAFKISDRLAMIFDGEIIFTGTPEEIRTTKEPKVRNFIDGIAPDDDSTETLLRTGG
ncbi:MAG: ABC transporter ATP-binding protein [Myxococcales bacterium]|nr:ABC transporter ATP-binding protein [Myxococcales bacterium]